MGERHRRKRVRSNFPPHSGLDNTILQPDEDVDCVNYDSDPDRDDPSIPSSQRYKSLSTANYSEDDDEEEEDEEFSEAELQINARVANESDVEVDIEFFDPIDADITPLSAFLKGFTSDCGVINCRELATAVCRQTRVGTVVRVGTDDSPIGFISCLNARDQCKLFDPLRRLLSAKSGESKIDEILNCCFDGEARFESHRMGIILCERVMNLPPQIVPKMYEALICELTWALEDEPTQMLRDSYRFGWYLYVLEVFIEKDQVGREDEVERKRKRNGEVSKDGKESKGDGLIYKRIEDGIWLEHASYTVEWNVQDSEQSHEGCKKKRIAALVSAPKLKKIHTKLNALLGVVGTENEAQVTE